jgi:alpha-mannosidase
VRVRLGTDGTIVSLYDKEMKREMIEEKANRLLLWEDIPYDFDAWDISHYYRETRPRQARLVSRRVASKTALCATIRQSFQIGKSTVDQEISLAEGSKVVVIKNKVAWNERHKLLRVHADAAVRSLEASYEVQFGIVRRPTHENTTWDQARFEVCAHTFADLSAPDYGLSILNNCKYGHSCRGSSLELSLLRSPTDPDTTADIGVHEFTYAYYPHANDLVRSDVLKKAHELNTPVIVNPVARAPKAASRSYFSISQGTVKIETVKKAENSSALVLRVYETMGMNATVTLSWALPLSKVKEADMLEKPLNGIAARGRSCRLSFKPFEIKTLLLS